MEKRKKRHPMGYLQCLLFLKLLSSHRFNTFHRKDCILKVTYITFNISQEGNIFCRYFSRHK